MHKSWIKNEHATHPVVAPALRCRSLVPSTCLRHGREAVILRSGQSTPSFSEESLRLLCLCSFPLTGRFCLAKRSVASFPALPSSSSRLSILIRCISFSTFICSSESCTFRTPLLLYYPRGDLTRTRTNTYRYSHEPEAPNITIVLDDFDTIRLNRPQSKDLGGRRRSGSWMKSWIIEGGIFQHGRRSSCRLSASRLDGSHQEVDGRSL